jgi:hypothetical protein
MNIILCIFLIYIITAIKILMSIGCHIKVLIPQYIKFYVYLNISFYIIHVLRDINIICLVLENDMFLNKNQILFNQIFKIYD